LTGCLPSLFKHVGKILNDTLEKSGSFSIIESWQRWRFDGIPAI